MNNLYYYIPYFYVEKNTTRSQIKNGAFYRLYGYDYVDGKSKSYGASQTPLLLVLGFNRGDKLMHCIKLNSIPLRVFSQLMQKIQDPLYVVSLLQDIQDSNTLISEKNEYDKGAKAIKIDATGQAFYQKQVKNNVLLKTYDCYRTYKVPGLKRLGEIYFNVEKLGKKIGLKIQPVGRK
jgi:hypothetical protein